ncbi:MAG: hypothetical protein ACRDIC_08675, partial [bacterium]
EKNRLDGSGWNAIRTYLFQHFRALQRALTTDAVAPHIMATLHNISRITGNLIRLGATAPPEPPLTQSEGMAILIEQIELPDLTQLPHRAVGEGARTLRNPAKFHEVGLEIAKIVTNPRRYFP